jgi:CBS-domain-containing membrane protein
MARRLLVTTYVTSTQHVYERRGDRTIRVPISVDDAPADDRVPTIADQVPVRWIMSRDVICARENLDLDTLVELVVNHRIGCVPVVDSMGMPIGMVTKQDLVEHVLMPPVERVLDVKHLMMPLAFTLDEHASVARAAAMLAAEGIHHVPVVSEGGQVVGVVSSSDIVRWLAMNDGVLPTP